MPPPRIRARLLHTICCALFFLFQAEGGIRDWSVTGVQTCALPIYLERCLARSEERGSHLRKAHALLAHCHRMLGDEGRAWEACARGLKEFPLDAELRFRRRSEERRVGKEWRERSAAECGG